MRAFLTFVVVLVAVVVIVLVVGAYTVVPSFLGSQVASVVRDELALSREPEVTLRSSPAPNVYRGDFSGGEILMTRESFGDFRIRSVEVDLDPFDVDVMQSISARRPVLENGDVTGDLRAVVPGEEVARIASESAGLSDVQLEGDELIVRRAVPLFLGIEVPAEVRGNLSLEGENLSFVPSEVAVAGESLPGDLTAQLLGTSEFAFPLEGIPPQMSVTDARIEDGDLVLEGRVGRFFE